MYDTLILSKDQVRQFALDIYDQLIQDIKTRQENEQQDETNKDYSAERLVA